MYYSRPFSLRMRPILYFHARKFYMSSNLSSSLVLGAILSSRSLKIEISQNENMALLRDVINWGELVGPLDFWRSQIFTLQNLLARFQFLQISYSLVFCSFLFQSQIRFDFPRDPPTQKFRSRAQYMCSREAQLSMQSDLQNSNFDRNLISCWRERRDSFTMWKLLYLG